MDDSVMRFSQMFGEQLHKEDDARETNEKAAKALWDMYASFRSAGFDGDQAMQLLCTVVHTQLSK